MKIIDFLEYELEDDDTEYGGISFLGEKVKDFFDDINGNGGNSGIALLLSDDIEVLNKVLKDCGIKEIKGRDKEDRLYNIFMKIVGCFTNEEIIKLTKSLEEYTKEC